MDKDTAWRKFSKSGCVEDYLEFRNCTSAGMAEAKQNANEHRRPGAKGDGYRGK